MDDSTKKFALYLLGTGVLMLVLACLLQAYLVPGSSGRIPIISDLIDPIEEEDPFAFNAAPEMIITEGSDYSAVVVTNRGDIKMDLYEENAPQTVNNFVFLSSRGYYNGVSFHRVFKDFLIQTGDRNTLDDNPDNDGFGGPGYTIPDEMNWETLFLTEEQKQQLTNSGYVSTPNIVSRPLRQYSVAMANTGQPNTAGSQFFIVTAESTDTKLKVIQGKYTVFGRVIEGIEAVESINSVEVDATNPQAPKPTEEVFIDRIEILVDGSPLNPSSPNNPGDFTVTVD